jgi:hypothetical protein
MMPSSSPSTIKTGLKKTAEMVEKNSRKKAQNLVL